MDQRVETRKALTDAFCRAQTAPASGRLEFADLRCAGLSFRVTSKGSRTFCFRFRDPLTRASTRATIGTYPDIGLGEARTRADAMRATVAGGANPVIEKRKGRAGASQRAFSAIAERFMVEHSRRKKRSADGDDRNLNLHILPKWKSRQIDDIRRADLIELVEGLVATGKPVLANRVQSLISSIFSFALDADLLSANPCARLRKRGEETAGTRILSDSEIRLFWRRSLLPPLSRGVGLAMRLQLLTGARPSEAAEINLNELQAMDKAGEETWIIPGSRTKNKRTHLIPLSAAAVAVVQAGLELIDDDDAFLFPSPTREDSSIDGHALAVAMRRLSESEKLTGPGSKTWKAEPPTPHDLRRTFATRLAELGVPKEDRDACLNHTPTDVGSKHYDLYERAKEKRAAMGLWASTLTGILRVGQAS
ncbi:MAG: site-specific integrase [Bradyrhizobium sp.]|uniref:tyrosine-type recombinase/integrase n=1 Tax=Bradyrhizobium sp. TaxID=376 RepID=UPI00271EDA1C|nr:site-specific integrase [Bradyrhizobium sp.]MDO8398088.1 site-specific integrase [Bradyrhizobium sp.]